jgi:ubiquinone/menaquinone biosynthesis C-methylase UbiE
MSRASVGPNQALWEKGDFTRIAATMRESGEALVQRIGIARGLRLLDVGCGDGTTALPAAKAGAQVLGVDIARNLVEAGNRRAAELGLANCRFQQGDVTNLQQIPDHAFDMVVSIFGAMFAPEPFHVAKEMVRVARPGGRIVMGNWIPHDPTLVAQILRISAAYTPPPTMGAFEAASKSGREASLQAALEELFTSQNTGADGTTIPATFLRVEVTC